jgi:predicted phosphodiesterase
MQVCERCGRTFGCGADDATCWCSATVADREVLVALQRDFSRCLCPICLRDPALHTSGAPSRAGAEERSAMRLAVVSDVHGSLTALDAVIGDLARRAPDVVLHGGDLALMGPQPAEVVDRIRELGWAGVVGNTDELLWRPEERERLLGATPRIADVIRLLFDAYAPATRELLGDERLRWLTGLPAELLVDGVLVVHASPGDLWRAPMPDADDDELERTYRRPDAHTSVYGHIHRPFARRAGDGLVVANAGSAGLPWDGDPRASYAVIEDGRAEIVRVEYDIERDAELLTRSGHPDAARLAEMRRLGRFIRPG